VPAGGLWDGRSVSGGDASQNGAPPPPPPPSGSPFGRFLTQPVFLVALLALMVSVPVIALALNDGGGGTAASPPQSAVVGDWAGPAVAPDAEGPVEVELTIRSLRGGDDGTFLRGRCGGVLSHRGDLEFSYVEQRDPDRCPRRSTVVVTPVGDDRLRFEERRGGRVVAEGVLRGR
jgi:hypothetical protein